MPDILTAEDEIASNDIYTPQIVYKLLSSNDLHSC